LGIPLDEQKILAGVVAVDAVFDSVSVKTTFREKLKEQGVIFCSFGEAVQEHPDLVKKYLGTVVPQTDNIYAALNSAVFSDGSFVYVPKALDVQWNCLLFPYQCTEYWAIRTHVDHCG
jgi:Fe-S cluster assembly protein SufB